MSIGIFEKTRNSTENQAAVLLALYSPEQFNLIHTAISTNPKGVLAAYNDLKARILPMPSPLHSIKLHPALTIDDMYAIVNGFSAVITGALKLQWNQSEYKDLLIKIGFSSKAAEKWASEIDTDDPVPLSSTITNFLKKAANSITFGWNPFNTVLADPDLQYEIMRLGYAVRDGMKHVALTSSTVAAASEVLKLTGPDYQSVGDVADLSAPVYGDVPDMDGIKDYMIHDDVYVPASTLKRTIRNVESAINVAAPLENHQHSGSRRHSLSNNTASVLKTLIMREPSGLRDISSAIKFVKDNEQNRAQWALSLKDNTNVGAKDALLSAIKSYDVVSSLVKAPILVNLKIDENS